jgi:hypothetical protein
MADRDPYEQAQIAQFDYVLDPADEANHTEPRGWVLTPCWPEVEGGI